VSDSAKNEENLLTDDEFDEEKENIYDEEHCDSC
jgi:hypothetical protein